MKQFTLTCILVVLVSIFAQSAINAQSSGPSIWAVNTRADILQGDARSVSVDPNGTITPAPKFTEIFKTGEPYIWSAATDENGNTYLGTGSGGKIFKVSADGKGAVFADLGELNVSSVAVAKNGRVFAATSPDGKVYSINASGTATIHFDPKEKYIWSIAVMPDESLMVATGENGKIFRVRNAGADPASSLFYDSVETHIISLTAGAAGTFYAGTDPGGIVLRFDGDGKPFALLDSELREIHEISLGTDGSAYVLALGESASAATPPPTPSGTPEKKSVTPAKTPSPTPAPPAKSRYDLSGARSAVYRIFPNGGSEIIWSSSTVTGFSIFAKPEGGVLLGTSDKGRIFQISDDGRETLLLQSDADQISNIFVRRGGLFAVSSNQGSLFSIAETSGTEGVYESAALDAKTAASWGRIWWRSSGDVRIQTRSGNTETPDGTWTEWSSAHSDQNGAPVTSVRARFLQWRATLKNSNAAARLNEVSVAYRPANIAPEVLSITILPANVGLLANPQPQIDPNISLSGLDPQHFGLAVAIAPPRRVYQRGAKAFLWTAEDRNGDDLVYDVFFKALADADYKQIAENISEAFFSLDGTSLPDGRYTVKVVAKDSLQNTPAESRTGEMISEPFDIDNTQPAVTLVGTPTVAGNIASVTFSARDASSYLMRAEYSINGGDWKPIRPVDGISDSPEERYSLSVPLRTRGEHTIVLRVFDAVGNTGNAKASVRH